MDVELTPVEPWRVRGKLVRRDLESVTIAKAILPSVEPGQVFKIEADGQPPQFQTIRKVEDVGIGWRVWFDSPGIDGVAWVGERALQALADPGPL